MPRGGARPGAGRPRKKQEKQQPKPAPKDQVIDEGMSPLDYMLKVMRDPSEDPGRRDRMAVAAAPYLHRKTGEQGAKSKSKEQAEKASTGKFAPTPAPLKRVK
jgi:hypothetical protein